jgi:undecaprenyl-diphosphatase
VGLLRGREGERRARARLLERAGLVPPAAHAATVRTGAAGLAGAALVAVAALGLAATGPAPDWRSPAGVLPAAAIGLAAWLLVAAGQVVARRTGADTAAPVPRDRPASRQDLVALLGWAVLATALEAAVLVCAVQATGGGVPVPAVAGGYAVLRLLWIALPASGLPGAPEATLVLLLGVLGTPAAAACAAVLVTRSLTTWGPAVVGLVVGRRTPREVLRGSA